MYLLLVSIVTLLRVVTVLLAALRRAARSKVLGGNSHAESRHTLSWCMLQRIAKVRGTMSVSSQLPGHQA